MLTAGQAISRADEIKPNDCGTPEKLETLRTLDRQIVSEIIMTHELPEGETVPTVPDEYTADTPLIAGDHPEIYVARLLCAVDLRLGDLVRYNNDSELFNAGYAAFRNEYNRTRPGKSRKLR